MSDTDFHVRPGRIRERGTRIGGRRPSFINQALRAAAKARGAALTPGEFSGRKRREPGARRGRKGKCSRIGRGQAAAERLRRSVERQGPGQRLRRVVVKAHIARVKLGSRKADAHLRYLQREGTTRDGGRGILYGPDTDNADGKDFLDRGREDRHQFRFIISTEDSDRIEDLRGFTRDVMQQMQEDLGTKLDWVAIDHFNTGHPHSHVLIRGKEESGKDLIIAQDYITDGLRIRFQERVTLELGPETDLELRQKLEAEMTAERFTRIDRILVEEVPARLLDLRPDAGQLRANLDKTLFVGRLKTLERYGLASETESGIWSFSERLEPTLRELGERGDIIKRMHRALSERGTERSASSYVLAGESLADPIVGRLIDCGLDDELKGTGYAVVDGTDGRTHHIRLPDLDAIGDGPPGSIVELRRFEDAYGRERIALAIRSDLDLEAQVTASGATWIDRQLVAREPAPIGSGGFGAEVRAAMETRSEHLIKQGLARRQAQQVIYARNLLETLRRRELESIGEKLTAEIGMPFRKSTSGEYVTGLYRQRLMLASGRFAMIDDGLGFQLVPWSPSLERHLGRHISGVTRTDGGIDWNFGRQRGLGL
ncbi:MAG: relaxase/mobilization nuclease domain-containing protein [Pseudorhodoplanes sp.]|uniref:relaxase/mobilization nuclease domain-containing protein n=1 Tax=Pseudorhodoplanes sp. TaxID=1934341 RepID=UPI003D143EB4